MRRALIVAAVTSGVMAARRRRDADPVPRLPAQRTLDRRCSPRLIDDDADLSVAEQQAQDDRVLAALDRY